MVILTLIIAVAGIASAVGTIVYAGIAHRTYQAAQQIYVGITHVGCGLLPDPNRLRFTIVVQALGGNVPAREVVSTYTVFLNGVSQPGTRVLDRPHYLFPNTPLMMEGFVVSGLEEILNGKMALEIETDVRYTDFYSQKHQYLNRIRFEPVGQNFMKLSETIDGI